MITLSCKESTMPVTTSHIDEQFVGDGATSNLHYSMDDLQADCEDPDLDIESKFGHAIKSPEASSTPPLESGSFPHHGKDRGLGDGNRTSKVHLRGIIKAVDYLIEYGLWFTRTVETCKKTPTTCYPLKGDGAPMLWGYWMDDWGYAYEAQCAATGCVDDEDHPVFSRHSRLRYVRAEQMVLSAEQAELPSPQKKIHVHRKKGLHCTGRFA